MKMAHLPDQSAISAYRKEITVMRRIKSTFVVGILDGNRRLSIVLCVGLANAETECYQVITTNLANMATWSFIFARKAP